MPVHGIINNEALSLDLLLDRQAAMHSVFLFPPNSRFATGLEGGQRGGFGSRGSRRAPRRRRSIGVEEISRLRLSGSSCE